MRQRHSDKAAYIVGAFAACDTLAKSQRGMNESLGPGYNSVQIFNNVTECEDLDKILSLICVDGRKRSFCTSTS